MKSLAIIAIAGCACICLVSLGLSCKIIADLANSLQLLGRSYNTHGTPGNPFDGSGGGGSFGGSSTGGSSRRGSSSFTVSSQSVAAGGNSDVYTTTYSAVASDVTHTIVYVTTDSDIFETDTFSFTESVVYSSGDAPESFFWSYYSYTPPLTQIITTIPYDYSGADSGYDPDIGQLTDDPDIGQLTEFTDFAVKRSYNPQPTMVAKRSSPAMATAAPGFAKVRRMAPDVAGRDGPLMQRELLPAPPNKFVKRVSLSSSLSVAKGRAGGTLAMFVLLLLSYIAFLAISIAFVVAYFKSRSAPGTTHQEEFTSERANLRTYLICFIASTGCIIIFGLVAIALFGAFYGVSGGIAAAMVALWVISVIGCAAVCLCTHLDLTNSGGSSRSHLDLPKTGSDNAHPLDLGFGKKEVPEQDQAIAQPSATHSTQGTSGANEEVTVPASSSVEHPPQAMSQPSNPNHVPTTFSQPALPYHIDHTPMTNSYAASPSTTDNANATPSYAPPLPPKGFS